VKTSRLLLLAATLWLSASSLHSEPKAAKPAELPKLVVAVPLGVTAGATTKITLRGQKLDGITDVHCQASAATVKLLKKSTASDIPHVGNTQAEIELTLPADFADATVEVSVDNAAGESKPLKLIVDKKPAVPEKEPNNGFAQAQPIAIGQTVAGAIDRGFDVDVYRFEGKAGQTITAEVFANRLGSPLDSFLTLYTGDGQTVIANDDLDATTSDSRLEATLPRDGAYYLVLVDANDHGGPAHVYRLSLQAKR
jgi:hypothetical protein